MHIHKKLISAIRGFRSGWKVKAQAAKLSGRRSYQAGALNRLTQDWRISGGDGDSEVRFDIEPLRERSRDLERSGGLMLRFLNASEKNVLKTGCGFELQNRALNGWGRPDLAANEMIEEAWAEWCKPKNCTVTGEESFYEVCRLALRSRKRDGGYLLRKIIDPKANAFGFTLQMYEIDYLDVNYNEVLGNGNKIIMGVEKNAQYKTIAYHMLTEHPKDMMFGGRVYRRVRIPAEEIIHYFLKQRQSQCVGVPEASAAMLGMHHLREYEISEMIAARGAANKGGYFTPGDDGESPYSGENEQTTGELGTEKTGAILGDSEPGQMDMLPKGAGFIPYDPTHPTQQFGDFVRNCKLGIASGLDMAYSTLVGDMADANFSSMRTGLIDERRTFMKEQAHMIEHLVIPIFEPWLATAMTMRAVNISMSRFAQVNKPMFRGVRWDWVDPLKDMQAEELALKLKIKTRQQIIEQSDSDMDLEETFAQSGYEKELAKEEGIELEEKPAAQQKAKMEPDDAAASNGNGRKIVVAGH